jgi:NAD(P)-dependent dehydrogenase (short-subunit alcohol dehydrogenase family)
MNLESLASIRGAAMKVRELEAAPVHILLCNAGMQIVSGPREGEGGVERTFAVNHLGHFLFANLLLEHLTTPARIIFTSSGTHDPSQKTGIPAPRFSSAELVAFPDWDPEQSEETPMRAGQRRYSNP